MLTHEEQRALYDYERWLSGRFQQRAAILDPPYLLLELQKLNAHLAQVDVYRMNKQLLHQYLLFLFSDDKIGIIQLKAEAVTRGSIIEEGLKATLHLPFYYSNEILNRLLQVAADDGEAQPLRDIKKRLEREARWQKLFPWLVAAVVLLLCVAMYLFSGH